MQSDWEINNPNKDQSQEKKKKSSLKRWKINKINMIDHLHKRRRNVVGTDIQLVSEIIVKFWQQSDFTQIFWILLFCGERGKKKKS